MAQEHEDAARKALDLFARVVVLHVEDPAAIKEIITAGAAYATAQVLATHAAAMETIGAAFDAHAEKKP